MTNASNTARAFEVWILASGNVTIHHNATSRESEFTNTGDHVQGNLQLTAREVVTLITKGAL